MNVLERCANPPEGYREGKGRTAAPGSPIAAFREAQETLERNPGVWFKIWIEDDSCPTVGKPTRYIGSGIRASTRKQRSDKNFSTAVRVVEGKRTLYVAFMGKRSDETEEMPDA